MTRTHDRIKWLLRVVVPPAAIASVISILLVFPPATHDFYPRCPFRELLDLQCPGCGATRAIAALLHGDIAEALRWNALTVLVSPFVAAYGVVSYRRLLRGESIGLPRPRPAGIYAAFVLATVFTVVRNVPHRIF